ncbi:MAG TPA: prepilin-type N-terminal cleavage/methylation domain-containing protein [Candidatus Saccharimonadales bacterium]|nr:prepilin-type N-terminal cleavage/methylation domain-containing protein [Candidatus Saccharimonadales bacterium]
MYKSKSGFTIVELLIVIVIIGILAAITVVTYSGIQQRARDTARTSDMASIQKALEIYRTSNPTYPPRDSIGTNQPAGFSPRYGSSYEYSVATNGSWQTELVDEGILNSVQVDPLNDNNHYYIYWASGPNGYGACTEPFYVLVAYGYESGNIPTSSQTLTCTMPDGSFGSHWAENSTQAVFSNTQTP